MSDIRTLIPDIYRVLNGDDLPLATGNLPSIEEPFSRQIESWSRAAPGPEDPVYASEYGDGCLRKLWYKRNAPEKGEPLAPYVKFKFMYGDTIEELALTLAKLSGHTVSHKQERISLEDADGRPLITGRIDAVIDGHLVDVKSMSTFAFNKYQSAGGFTEENDSFGYRWQLALYHYKMVDEGVVQEGDQPMILGVDKQLGHMALMPILDWPSRGEVAKRAARAKAAIKLPEPPERGFTDEPEGASGNRKLGVACSYCPFKAVCWPGLRTFLYSNGPRFLTYVEKEPKVAEINHGTS